MFTAANACSREYKSTRRRSTRELRGPTGGPLGWSFLFLERAIGEDIADASLPELAAL
jgi:hypothetical protein